MLLAVASVSLSGCGHEAQKTVYAVEGKLLIGGRPAANANLAFHPAGKSPAKVCPVATTGTDGSFRLTTYRTADGAPEGEYVVTVLWPDDSIEYDECECPDPAQHDRLAGVYAHARTSPLRATVRAERNELTLSAQDLDELLKGLASSTPAP